MKSKLIQKSIILSAAVLLIGSATAFAHGGGWGGYGGHMMGYYGGHMMDYDDGPMMGPGYGYGPGMYGNGYGGREALSEEQAAKLDAIQEKFYKETLPLRSQIDEKRLALRDEMIKEKPDVDKATKLQKELSALEAEFDQKALAYRLEVRQLLPERAFDRGNGRGYGRGHGGYCW
jgi:zinc resistance-associated protein